MNLLKIVFQYTFPYAIIGKPLKIEIFRVAYMVDARYAGDF